jgi:hypothetical protein
MKHHSFQDKNFPAKNGHPSSVRSLVPRPASWAAEQLQTPVSPRILVLFLSRAVVQLYMAASKDCFCSHLGLRGNQSLFLIGDFMAGEGGDVGPAQDV